MEKTFTTSRGVTVEFVGVAPLLDKLEAQRLKTLPQIPTYLPATAAGFVPQPLPHHHQWIKVTETDENGVAHEVDKLDSTLDTPEAYAAWGIYQQQLKEQRETYTKTFARTVLLRGIKVELPQDESWVKEQEFMGYEVPTDPFERRYYWLETEMATTKEEFEQLVMGVLAASGVSEEVIADMEESFRSQVGRADTKRTDDANPDLPQSVADELTLRASGNGREGEALAVGV